MPIINLDLKPARTAYWKPEHLILSLLWLTILFGWFPAFASIACVRPILLHADTGESAIPTTRLSRLTKEALFTANNTPAGTITHAYDGVGNRTTRTVQGLGATVDPIANQNLAFDQRDLILGPNGAISGSTNPDYDLNGNSLTDEFGNPTHDLYDAENRLISRGGGQITIGYDEDGHRVFETSGGATTVFLVDDRNPTGYSQVLAEYPGGTAASSANAPTVTYTYGLELIAQNRSGVVRFYGYDGQGSVRLLTDANATPPIQLIPQALLLTAGYDGLNGSGAVPSANSQVITGPPTAVTDTYGQLLAQTGSTSNNYRYTGQAWDPALGMYHLRARYYQPGIGRFWTMDTEEGSAEDPKSLHKYLYCYGNPSNRKDFTGRFSEVEISIASTEAATLDTAAATAASIARAFAIRRLETALAVSTARILTAIAPVFIYEGIASYKTSQALEQVKTQTAERANPTGSSYAYQNLECAFFARDAKKYFNDRGDEPRFIRFQAYYGKIKGDFIWACFGLLSGQIISESGTHWGCIVDGRVYDNNLPFGVPQRVWEKYCYKVAPADQPAGAFLRLRSAVKQGYGQIDFPASIY